MATATPARFPGRFDHNRSHLWAIVLAGGEGVRLRPLVRHVCGDERPKQYVPLLDSRTLLRQTVDRAAQLVPAERIIVVTLQDHATYVANELRAGQTFRILVQPEGRGTAAGVLFPAHWIQAQDPEAVVVVFPSDHYIQEEALFVGHLADVASFIGRHHDRIVLVGAQPTDPETEYGWIEPGERVGWLATTPVYQIRGFREKPSAEVARTLFASGSLWNTMIFGARASALIEAGRQCIPQLHERLARLPVFLGTEHEPWAIRHAFSLAPTANFSRAILQVCPDNLVVSKVPGLTWCDLGTPERVMKTVSALGLTPPWLEHLSAESVTSPAPVLAGHS